MSAFKILCIPCPRHLPGYFERLERLGIHCLDVPSQGLPVALINRYLMIKQRGLI